MRFSKYQALGNAYVVVPPTPSIEGQLSPIAVHLSDYRVGIGSDGVLFGPFISQAADFRLRIFNPDGSEAEKSGNGLRIFCQFLYDEKLVHTLPFTIETKGGIVSAQVHPHSGEVKVSMGKVSFNSKKIPVTGPERDVLGEEITVGEHAIRVSCATIGNPHCVVFSEFPSESVARNLGPLLESHGNFPNRTNVQFVKVTDRANIQMEIWERGAGYTHASGSSSCAAAAVAYKHGLVDSSLTVNMRGGKIEISISDSYEVTMTGPVEKICEGFAVAKNV